jgi:small GTP-binding protein
VPLDSKFRKQSGEPYLSGTEWEFEDAIQSAQKPPVLIYRRTEELKIGISDPHWPERIENYRRLELFFDRLKNPDGSLRRGIGSYSTPTEFRLRLESDIKMILRERLPSEARIADAAITASAWIGSPYPGLRPFTNEEAAIFFGREREVDAIVAQLRDPTQRFMAVTGVPGVGKSSLVRAGLLPQLARGAIEGSQHWRVLAFSPGAYGDNPFLALAVELRGGLPPGQAQRLIDIADALTVRPQFLLDFAEKLLANRPAGAALVLFIDQLEELFTLTAEPHRRRFIELLALAAADPRLRVLATLRADFLPQCATEPVLATLLQGGTFMLKPPEPAALLDIVRGPAERVGLTVEDGLVEEILMDAGHDPRAMPLMSFCMAELYGRAAPGRNLTLEAYRAMGGLWGAIGRQATELLKEFPETAGADLDTALASLFRALVYIDPTGKVALKRTFLDVPMAAPAPLPQLTETLIVGRILVAESAEGRPLVRLAHEALLQGWPPLHAWLQRHRAQMQRTQYLLSLAAQEPKEQQYALTELGKIGPSVPEVLPALIAALDDKEDLVRATAAEALGNIGPGALDAIPKLRALLRHSYPKICTRAAEAILRVIPVQADTVPALITALARTDRNSRDHTEEVLRATEPAVTEALSALLAALHDPDGEIGKYAAEVLVRIGPITPDLARALANPQAVLGYYLGSHDGHTALNDAKLVLVGSGGVGKTSLVNRLVYDSFNSQERKTEGIRITQWSVLLPTQERVRLRIWDFGGQEIMHATHQLFMTHSSLYLLVLDGRRDSEEADVEYWLDLIETLAPESPTIVVLNKIKEQAFDIDRRALQRSRVLTMACTGAMTCRRPGWQDAGRGVEQHHRLGAGVDLSQQIAHRCLGQLGPYSSRDARLKPRNMHHIDTRHAQRRFTPTASFVQIILDRLCTMPARRHWCRFEGDFTTMMRLITRSAAAFGVVLVLAACTNPYDPGQRALGGAAIGAGAGAAIGGAVGGWHGAGIGALAGGALGAVTGAVTTPHPPPPAYYSPPPRPAYNPPSY